MKRVISTILIAMIGGFISLGIYKVFEPEYIRQNADTTLNNASVKQVGLKGIIPDVSVDFSAAAEMTVNAVVHVKTESYNAARNNMYNDPFYLFFHGRGMQPGNPKPVLSAGSGVIVSQDGYIVTNNHVIEDADKIEVVLNDNKSYKAEVVGRDPATDLALLKVEAEDLAFISYGNSDETNIGEWVLAVGNPFNLTSTVTAGIVSAKGRSINILGSDPRTGMPSVESFIQTDAAVNPGNSGGALVNTKGELIGINSAIKSRTGSYVGYSFAIPSNLVSKVVRDLKEFGAVQRAFIGISIRNIDGSLAEQEGLKDMSGVYVAGTTEKGAAEDAGIEKGDIIKRIGSVKVNSVPELQEQVSQFRPGEEILVTLNREGKELEKKIMLKNFEGNTKMVKRERIAMIEKLGASFEEVNKEEKEKLKIDQGLKVTKLWNGKMSKAGIQQGFIITKIDNQPIGDLEDLNDALEGKRGGVLFEGVYPNGRSVFYGLGM